MRIEIEKWSWLLGLACLGLVACDGDDEGTDAGPDAGSTIDDAGTPDGGPGGDAGPADAGDSDAGDSGAGTDGGPVGCEVTGCDTGEACIRNVCVDTCGADGSGWDAALDADLRVVGSFCRDAAAFGTRVDGVGTDVFDLTRASVSDGSELTLSRWPADPSTTPSPSTVATVAVSHEGSLFPGGYVEASPSGDAVAFGYTLADFSGGVFRVRTADGGEERLAAEGNFDAAWLDDATLLINGLGLGTDGGQGLYAAVFGVGAPTLLRVATGLGSASGSVAVGSDYVLVGGLFGTFPDTAAEAYALPRAEVERVIAGERGEIVVATGDGTPDEGFEACAGCGTSTFALVHDHFVFVRRDASFTIEAIEARPVEGFSGSTGLTLGSAVEWTTGEAFTDALEASDDQTLLRFGGGLLLVAPAAG